MKRKTLMAIIAIVRADLLDYLHQPKQKEEVEATLMFLNKKIYGLAKRKKQIEAAYPEYCQGMQLRLF